MVVEFVSCFDFLTISYQRRLREQNGKSLVQGARTEDGGHIPVVGESGPAIRDTILAKLEADIPPNPRLDSSIGKA